MKKCILFILLIMCLKNIIAQQISFEGCLLNDDVFRLKCSGQVNSYVRSYFVCVLDSNLRKTYDLCFINSPDTLSKSDFKSIIWERIPNGKYYLWFYNIIYSDNKKIIHDEDFKLGDELIISFIKSK